MRTAFFRTKIGRRVRDPQFRWLLLLTGVYPLFAIPGLPDPFYRPRLYLLLVLALGCLGALLTTYRSHLGRLWRHLPGRWWGVTFLVLLVVSAACSPYPGMAWLGANARYTGVLTFAGLAVIFLYILSVLCQYRAETVLTIIFASGVLVAFIAAVQFACYLPQTAGAVMTTADFRNQYAGPMGNVNFLATYLLLVLMLGYHLFLSTPRPWVLGGIVLVLGMLILTMTRGVWIAAAVGTVLVLSRMARRPARRPLLLTMFLLIAGTCLVYPGVLLRAASFPSEMRLLRHRPQLFATDRGYIWAQGWQALRHNTGKEWLLGAGPDTFTRRVPGLYGGKPFIDKAHNTFLEIALTMGVPALVCLLGFLVNLCVWRADRPLATTMTVLLLAYAVQGFFNIDTIPVLPALTVVIAVLAHEKMAIRQSLVVNGPLPQVERAYMG